MTAMKTIIPTLTLSLFTLTLMMTPLAAEESFVPWQDVFPHLDTFSSYEDMQRYFDHRNQRSLRQLENPLDDSYVDAFNRHNEQEVQRPKRSSETNEKKELTNPPTLLKFEITDAVEPSDEVKDLIRQYRGREMQFQKQASTTNENSKSQEPKPKPIFKRTALNAPRKIKSAYAKALTRAKRSAIHQQPANFKVQLIPFDASDAREPDEQTKALIKRMRALDIEKLSKDLPKPDLPSVTQVSVSTTKKPFTKRNKYNKLRHAKRTRRAAPEMIKFEMSDAKDPSPALQTFKKLNNKPARAAKDLKVEKVEPKSAETKSTDQKSQESKRFFVYKEAPIKVKKSVSALPHDVQNIISHIIKNQGKALVKYIPAKQMDYNQFKMAYNAAKGGQGFYGHGGNAYVKYVPAPGKAEQVKVQIHSVPVVEKVRYVYTPVAVAAGGEGGGEGEQQAGYAYGGHEGLGAHASAGYIGGGNGHNSGEVMAHPIVVPEEGGGQKPTEIHYSYAAALPEPGHGGGGGHGAGGGHSAGGDGHGAGGGYAVAGGYGGGEGGGDGGGNEAVAAKQESKYSVAPTVEHYSKAYTNNVQTQGFEYKIYSPESLLLKAQLEAKEKVEAIKAEAEKAKALIAGHGGGGEAGNAGKAYGGGHGYAGYGGGGGHGAAGYEAAGHAAEGYGGGGHGAGGYGGGGHGAGGYGGGGHVAGGYGEGGHGGSGEVVYGAAGHGAGGYGGGGHGGDEEAVYGHGKAEYAAVAHGAGGYGAGGYGGGGAKAAAGPGPVIKIEYHAPAASLNENYKEMPEFKHLSSLVGKSPEDQIHGLTYLLAKEMQNRLHTKNLNAEAAGKAEAGYAGEGRPQDNKAPILFHPEEAYVGGAKGGEAVGYVHQPGKIIGMAKLKQYIPVIEPSPSDDYKAAAAALAIVGKNSESGEEGGGGAEAGKAKVYGGGAGGHSYISYGLSPNYKGFSSIKLPAPAAPAKPKGNGKQAYVGVGSHNGLHEAGYESAVQKMQSYASKYAFGYRIRDFSTGNDFGHNQNRDLNGVTRGQYHILLPDGRIQNVIYHADDTGFHADVSFEGEKH